MSSYDAFGHCSDWPDVAAIAQKAARLTELAARNAGVMHEAMRNVIHQYRLRVHMAI